MGCSIMKGVTEQCMARLRLTQMSYKNHRNEILLEKHGHFHDLAAHTQNHTIGVFFSKQNAARLRIIQSVK